MLGDNGVISVKIIINCAWSSIYTEWLESIGCGNCSSGDCCTGRECGGGAVVR